MLLQTQFCSSSALDGVHSAGSVTTQLMPLLKPTGIIGITFTALSQ